MTPQNHPLDLLKTLKILQSFFLSNGAVLTKSMTVI